MPAPLELRLSTKKPRTIAGEGIVLDIAHKVSADLEMETVELNRDRTSVRVAPLGSEVSAATLTGADHIELHRVHPFSEIGRRFRAPAGSAWVSSLALMNYTRPLEAGRYRIDLSYRWGKAGEEAVVTNAIEVEVVPSVLLTAEFRWFGGSHARDQLGTIWTAQDGQKVRWMYQTSSGRDPGAILSALDLELLNAPRAHPRLGYLNDIAAMHYERYVVWVEGGRLGYMRISDEQRLSEPAFVNHGMEGEPQLVDPPLQCRGGGMWAVLAGTGAGQRRLVLVEIDGRGNTRSRIVGATWVMRGVPVVIWNDSDTRPAGNVYFLTEDRHVITRVDLATGTSRNLTAPGGVFFLGADQWLERGTVLALAGRKDALEVVGWDNARPEAEPVVFARYEPEMLRSVLTGGVAGGATLPDPPDLALLFPGRDAWAILARDKHHSAVKRNIGSPRLVGTRGGLFVLEYLAHRGFWASRLDGAAPPDLL